MKLTRQEAYALIDSERDHQNQKWPQAPALPPSDEIRLVRVLAREADDNWYVTQDVLVDGVKVNDADLIAARKIAAVCVRVLETYGAPAR